MLKSQTLTLFLLQFQKDFVCVCVCVCVCLCVRGGRLLLMNVQDWCVHDNGDVMTAVFSGYLLILNYRYGVQLE